MGTCAEKWVLYCYSRRKVLNFFGSFHLSFLFSLCYLKEGPCGGVASADPATTLTGGQDFTIMFQQNLNHFYIDNPGKLVADFANSADPAEADFVDLGSPVSDYNAVSN